MKTFLALLLLTTISVGAAQHTNGNYVVTLNDDQDPDVVSRFHSVAVRQHNGKRAVWKSARTSRGFAATLTGNQADKLALDSRVSTIEPDVAVTNCAVPLGIQRVGCQANALWVANGAAVHNRQVAIIDTGICLTHPNLNVISNVSFVTGASTGNDDRGHGSHVAGIVAGKGTNSVFGVCPGAGLWAVKVLDANGSGSLSQIIMGVDYVTQHSDVIEVANMSLGGQGLSTGLRTAIQAAVAKGVVFVVAAGNATFEIYGGDKVLGTSDDFFPAAYPEVMTVAAIGDEDGIPGGYGGPMTYGVDDCLAYFSNYSTAVDASNPVYSSGMAVDVCAPGVNVYSTYMGNSYATMSGTSMAAPHVAGAVALYIAANARATTAAGVYAIRQAIIDRGTEPTHWGVWADPVNPVLFNIPNAPLIDVSDGAKPTTYPVITLTRPWPMAGGAEQHLDNATFTCTATATDATDGDLTAKIVWRAHHVDSASSIWTKELGTGGSISALVTNRNVSLISAGVSNSVGHFTQANAKVLILAAPVSGTAPNLAITAPAAGATYANTDLITFTATCTDAQDGNIASKVAWRSSLDGDLGMGSTIQNYLSAGSQTVTAWLTNSLGISTNKTVALTITGTPPPATNYPPSVSITQPASGTSFPQGTTINFVGTATDSVDGDLSSQLLWTDNVAGPFANGATASTNGLAVGTHTITATVTNSLGRVGIDQHTLTVTSTTPMTVVVAANRSVYPNKAKATITATVTLTGSAVSGATCNFTLKTATGGVQSKTATTGATGVATVTWPLQVNKLGSGLTRVTVNATKTGNVPGVGSTTFTINP